MNWMRAAWLGHSHRAFTLYFTQTGLGWHPRVTSQGNEINYRSVVPESCSVNDGIDLELCSLSYVGMARIDSLARHRGRWCWKPILKPCFKPSHIFLTNALFRCVAIALSHAWGTKGVSICGSTGMTWLWVGLHITRQSRFAMYWVQWVDFKSGKSTIVQLAWIAVTPKGREHSLSLYLLPLLTLSGGEKH